MIFKKTKKCLKTCVFSLSVFSSSFKKSCSSKDKNCFYPGVIRISCAVVHTKSCLCLTSSWTQSQDTKMRTYAKQFLCWAKLSNAQDKKCKGNILYCILKLLRRTLKFPCFAKFSCKCSVSCSVTAFWLLPSYSDKIFLGIPGRKDCQALEFDFYNHI